ncbi:MAG TPA: lamin tail domain-containing protein [Labilithrix sp.]|nr:lamin tail domain-containing protein [Labilithrix sp.]
MTRRILLVGLFGLAVVAACSQQAPASAARICTPGNYVFCRCKDRSEGTKLCIPDGTGFDPCEGCLSGSEDNNIGEPEPAPDPVEDAGPEPDSAPPLDAGPPVGDRPKAGELFITEIMYDPSGNEPTDEWFEIFSIAPQTVTLNGMFIKDGASRVHVLGPTPEMKLAPNQHMVLVRNKPAAVAAGVPSARILGEYGTGDSDTGGILLTNAATGALVMLDGASEIVRVAYGGFSFVQAPPGGASIQLKVPNAAQAKLATGWCLSTKEWAGQPAIKVPKDKGSPGAESSCP